MSFEFYCPNGHLLEGDDEQLGTEGRCPLCGTMFVFPKTTLIARQNMKARGGQGSGGAKAEAPAPELPAPEPRVIAVLCPRGHILDTPEEMLGTNVICPKCRVQFVPTAERSVAYLAQKHRYETQKAEVKGRFWLAVSILAATMVIVAIVVMTIYLRQPTR